ncbi:nucleic acid-binding, OB-fold protein [Artemisia annua]|uniref:Nucleic acid-binding, OB-fold protein n=1 Tax=Artemisia annua TaxID=35608 RepID=A0A2U1LVS2_ARTAN|nr:nucleic acid-binding, OB-fold protein [Artemisia annua]
MRIKRRPVPNRTAREISIEVSRSLDTPGLHAHQGSNTLSAGLSGAIDVGHRGTTPVFSPTVSATVQNGLYPTAVFCDIPGPSSSTDEPGTGHGVNNGSVSVGMSVLPHGLDLPVGVPAQVYTVDGLVSNFEIANVVPPPSVAARQRTTAEDSIHAGDVGRVPMVLDFSSGCVVLNPNLAPFNTRRGERQGRISGSSSTGDTDSPQVQGPVAPPQREGWPFVTCLQVPLWSIGLLEDVTKSANTAGHFLGRGEEEISAYFCSTAIPTLLRFWLSHFESHERRALREPIIQGLIGFLNENNALVKLFRTARDKLLQADIPNFSIRLFGVVGAHQYELPTADSVGAIVYDGGPEAVTDYDVVIERHSGEPESVNKLHPAYMALQFPLLFVYGEEANSDCSAYPHVPRKMALITDAGTSSKSTDKAVVPSRQLAYLAELNPTDNSKFIEVKVYRKWTTVKIPGFVPTAFSCMLLDKKGTAIQANADIKEKARFDHDLQLNCVYKIEGFGFDRPDSWGKTLDNDITLCFGKYTQVQLLQAKDFPSHYFNFAAFNELNARLEKKNLTLTDYIGYVHNVEKAKEYGGATTTRVKVRNIGIRNLNNNVVLFTLWNEDADNFPEGEYAEMKQPVILAVSSCYLKRYADLDSPLISEFIGQIQLSATSATRYYFNPDVPETGELLAAYSDANMTIPQLDIHTERLTNWEEERNRNRVPLATLLQIDPKTQQVQEANTIITKYCQPNILTKFNFTQRVLFTQDAMILQVDAGHDWYYQKCDECGGKLRYGYLHGQCHQYGTTPNPQNSYCFRIVITDGTANALMSCFTPQTDGLIKDVNTLLEEVDTKDPATIPPAILALQNTRHIFQFQFATPTLKGPPTFILKKIMDNPQLALLEPSAGPSSPQTNLPESPTDEGSTPPPATPTVTQDTPAGEPTETQHPLQSAARKKLFVPTTEEESNPALKKHKKD